MRVVIQRVTFAKCEIAGIVKSEIAGGLMVLVGVEDRDTDADIEWLSSKITNMRIFNDEAGVMNRSVKDVDGEIMVVSQFTLQASTKKGNRPSYIKASKHDFAVPMYEKFCAAISRELGKEIATGTFGADMKITLLNDGPTTIIMDSQNKDEF